MKILVVGSVPPPMSGHRQDLLDEVLRFRHEGHDVVILALDPLSAAHRFLPAGGIAAAIEIGLSARKFDAVVLQIEPGLPVRHSAGRIERMAGLLALAAALRTKAEVTVRLQHPDDLPGGLGGRAGLELWKSVARIEVGDEEMRAQLANLLGASGDSVAVSATSEPPAGSRLGLAAVSVSWSDGAATTAAQVQSVVRARAAAERESLAARGRLTIEGLHPGPRVPQWQWLPSPGAGVPDLGPIRQADRGAGRRRPRARRASSASAGYSMRRAVSAVLATAERWAVTRPLAHLARLTLIEVRAVVRRSG
ncbi:MAG: hypothetical protein ABSH30_00850 [Acidimicrobiales bacterium]